MFHFIEQLLKALHYFSIALETTKSETYAKNVFLRAFFYKEIRFFFTMPSKQYRSLHEYTEQDSPIWIKKFEWMKKLFLKPDF